MMATVPHVTSGLGLRKFQADGFLLTQVYIERLSSSHCYQFLNSNLNLKFIGENFLFFTHFTFKFEI